MAVTIKDIVQNQKNELAAAKKKLYIERDGISLDFKSSLINVVIGPRRAGKSCFCMHSLLKEDNFGYVNFDDESLIKTEDYDEIIVAIKSVYSDPKILFFDEIQNLPRWELFVNKLQRRGYKIVLTGSNANLLSTELSTHLTGRYNPVYVFPFGLKEIINGQSSTEAETQEYLDQFLHQGGYPEPVLSGLDIKNYLGTLLESIIYKDIIKRFKLRYSKIIEELAYYLLSNVSSEYSSRNIAKTLEIKSKNTIARYIDYLEETLILFTLPKYSFKVKDQIQSNKKIYSFDNGFIAAKGFSISRDSGKLLENTIASYFKKCEYEGMFNIFFWKSENKHEVDFVLTKANKVVALVQSCYDLGNKATEEREIKGLLGASKALGCNNLFIISLNKAVDFETVVGNMKYKITYLKARDLLKEGYEGVNKYILKKNDEDQYLGELAAKREKSSKERISHSEMKKDLEAPSEELKKVRTKIAKL
ncbi:MAG: hypothetical protein A2044_02560 [Candidatus Firestonebacteria bacterium GWA2_43_8]|nr:MAG: hypothetical protein A2044_02560 [Candidatus Firestonebacteria bacterium GWA2_43_8]